MEHSAVTNFCNYLRIKSVQPSPDYASCIQWLSSQAEELGGSIVVKECVPGKPIAVISVTGLDPSLPSILLNSHMDVVPVFPEYWKYDPFSAHKDDDGNIYARGTQDMKSVGVQYLEAMKVLKKNGKQLLRTVHISFVPDEELGGVDGMKKFVETEEFKKLNVAFGLDEGYANPTEKFTVFYGQRSPWWLWIKCTGQPGHGSQFISNSAGSKLQKVIDIAMKFRQSEEQRMKDFNLSLGDVTTVNLTMLKGGVEFNVVPAELYVGFDIRVPPNALETFEEKIAEWCKEAGDGVTYQVVHRAWAAEVSCVEDGKSKWWDAFSEACNKEGVLFTKELFPAGTDSAYLRKVGVQMIGFSPMNKTPILLHDHNEYLNEKTFLRGIDIYVAILSHIGNVTD